MTKPDKFDIVVLGGGSGLTAAWFAEQDDKSVALVETNPNALGGTCVNYGCIPTKTLIQAAEVMETIKAAERFGIEVDLSTVRPDFGTIMKIMRERRAEGSGGTRKWVEGSFTPFFGSTRFVDDKTLEMEDGRRLTGDTIFIAAGARAVVPPIEGLEKIPYLTNKTVLELEQRPEHLVVLGGGYIGCELAHFFASLGTKVSVIEAKECLLREDKDVRELFTKEFKKKVDLYNGARAKEAISKDGKTGFLVTTADGTELEVVGDQVLVAVGRRPNSDTLDLDKTGVKTDDKGWIEVDDHLMTTKDGIYAYGDVIGQGMFKHTSSYEGELAYKNSQGDDQRVSYRTNPHAVFSDPQVASVGLTEEACEEQGLSFGVAKSDYTGAMKGQIKGSPPGLAKLLYEKKTGKILGFHMVGPDVPALIHEVIVAMDVGDGTVDNIRGSIHIHPTMPELIRSVFDQAEV